MQCSSLSFGLPHLFGHFFGLNPIGVAVHESRVAAVAVAGACNSSVSIGACRQVLWPPDVELTSAAQSSLFSDNWSPRPVLVVGQKNLQAGSAKIADRAIADVFRDAVLPRVDHVIERLLLVWIHRAVVNIHLAVVLVLVPLTTDVGHKLDNPNTTIAGEFALIILGIQRQRKADLLEIIATPDAFGLVAGFTQTRQQDGQQQGNNGDYHQQFNQRKTL